MARIKMHIPKTKLPFYPPCEVKCRLQNEVSTQSGKKVVETIEKSTKRETKLEREREREY